MKDKLGIYAGSFNKFHIGHKNIFDKAENILGENNVIIAIGINPSKDQTILEAKENADNIEEKLNKKVIVYKCFLHELILQYSESYDVVLIRGLRSGYDLDHEENQLRYIKEFLPKDFNLNVMFLMCDEEYKHISSSAIRQLEKFKEHSGNKYIV